MAIVDTAESAVADAGRRECYLLCKEVKALLPRSQGFRLEFGARATQPSGGWSTRSSTQPGSTLARRRF